jgi:hypothetical protein
VLPAKGRRAPERRATSTALLNTWSARLVPSKAITEEIASVHSRVSAIWSSRSSYIRVFLP